MKPRLPEWTIVIAGQWNSRIFTPPWAANNLFKNKLVQVEMGVGPGVQFFKLSANDLVIIPKDESLIFAPSKLSDAVLRQAEVTAARAAELLPHTPVSAWGINFGFEEESISPELSGLFQFGDTQHLSDASLATAGERSILRKLTTSSGVELNLRLTLDDGKLLFHFNFNHKVNSAASVKEALEKGHVLEYRALALGLLEKAYHLHVDSEEGEASAE
jgi:hypothetical protein